MLAQGAKYQKRASFANDAARGKEFVPRHLWFTTNTNDSVKCVCTFLSIIYVCRDIPTGGVKYSIFLFFNISKKFLCEGHLLYTLCPLQALKVIFIQPSWSP